MLGNCLLVKGLEIECLVPQLKCPDPLVEWDCLQGGELGNLIELASSFDKKGDEGRHRDV